MSVPADVVPESTLLQPDRGARIGRLRADFTSTYATQLAALALGTVATLASARLLGPAGRGAYQILATSALEIGNAGSLGILVSAVYFIARGEIPSERIAGAVLYLMFVMGVLVSAIAWALRAPLGELLLDEQSSAALVLVGPLSAFSFGSAGLLSLYRGANQYQRFNVLTLIVQGLFVLSLVLGLTFVSSEYQTALVAAIVGYALSVALLSFRIWRNFGLSLRGPITVISRLIRFNALGHLGTFLQQISYRFDIFVLAAARGTREVGYYAVAVAIAQLLWYLPNALGMVLLSRTSAGEPQAANARLAAVSQMLVPLMVMLVGAAVLTAPVVIPFAFGNDFAPASRALALLSPGIVALGIWKLLANDLAGRGITIAKLYSAGPGALVTVVLDLLLIPRFGLEGAAIASSTAYVISTAVIVWSTARTTGLKVRRLLLLDRATLSLIGRSVSFRGES